MVINRTKQMKIKIEKLICKRCGYSWIPRTFEVRACARCHSPWWDKKKEVKK